MLRQPLITWVFSNLMYLSLSFSSSLCLQYSYLKPPTSPTPVRNKVLPAPAPVVAESATTTIVDEPELELEPTIKAATVQVNSEPAAKAATEQVITEAKPKSYSRPLSPYASVNLQTKATNYKETRKIVKPQLGLHLVWKQNASFTTNHDTFLSKHHQSLWLSV